MKAYPAVVGEFETIEACLLGRSLARFGDGELKIVYGAGYNREPPNVALSVELGHILAHPDRRCLVGIPTLDENGPKYLNWTRHAERFRKAVSSRVRYYSAFVTRPDSAPWINTRSYAELVTQLWAGKRVVVVCEKKNSLLPVVRLTAAKVRHVLCAHRQAFRTIDDLEREVFLASPQIAILSAGPTATCLAHRLARRNIQAIDFGSAGGFLRKLLQP